MGNRRAGSLVAAVMVLTAALTVVPSPPSHAATGRMATAVGGLGRGQATNVGQSGDDVAVIGHILYVADSLHDVVRAVDLVTSEETVVAGNGQFDPGGDGGPATAASLFEPRGLATDGVGNLYVSETFGHRVRTIAPDGTISTVAGTGRPGFTGDGGRAAEAALNQPGGLATDAAGNLYIADIANNRVPKVTTDGRSPPLPGEEPPGSPRACPPPAPLSPSAPARGSP